MNRGVTTVWLTVSHCSFHDETDFSFLVNFILIGRLQGQVQKNWEVNGIETHDVKNTMNNKLNKKPTSTCLVGLMGKNSRAYPYTPMTSYILMVAHSH